MRLALAGFKGPRTVFEGEHGMFKGFANTDDGNFTAMLDGFGTEWTWLTIAFKPYACGTMAHPYIDCARALRARGITAESIERIECDTAEGIVHRLWEPLAAKQQPPNGYAAKFSIPYAIAVGLLRDDAGLAEYDDALVHDAALTALARKIHYRVDPANPYPQRFTGHLRVLLKDGREIVERQDYFRGGAENPLSDVAIEKKFFANCAFGGMSAAAAEALARAARTVFSQTTVNLSVSATASSRPVALVTGASRNIGRRIALALAEAGHAVAVHVHQSQDEGAEVVDAIRGAGGDAALFSADVTDAAAVRAMIEAVAARWQRLDVLVNNAAVRLEAPLEAIDAAAWRHTLAVVLDGAFFCVQAALPLLRASPAAAIVNIGGLTGHTGAPTARARGDGEGGSRRTDARAGA